MPESWSRRHNRIWRERARQSRTVKGTGSWSAKARKASKHAKEEVAEVQGGTSGTWTARARRADRARKKRAGEEKSWARRLRGRR